MILKVRNSAGVVTKIWGCHGLSLTNTDKKLQTRVTMHGNVTRTSTELRSRSWPPGLWRCRNSLRRRGRPAPPGRPSPHFRCPCIPSHPSCSPGPASSLSFCLSDSLNLICKKLVFMLLTVFTVLNERRLKCQIEESLQTRFLNTLKVSPDMLLSSIEISS